MKIDYKKRIEQNLARLFTTNNRLEQAMSYSVLSSGKRLRPIFVYSLAATCNIPIQQIDEIANAVELLHCYSLIHDDLPMMDDDDFRRGQASCHRKFDEATAILAGDALQSLAFNRLSFNSVIPANIQIKIKQELSNTIRYHGLALGQSLDMQYKDLSLLDEKKYTFVNYKKTAIFFIACAKIITFLAHDISDNTKQLLLEFATHFGIAFQLKDDLQDLVQDEKIVYYQQLQKKLTIEYKYLEKNLERLKIYLSTENLYHLVSQYLVI